MEARRRQAALKSAASVSDPAARSRRVQLFNRMRALWRDRRRACTEAAELLAEGAGKRTAVFLGELGLETDADAGVELPPPLPEARTK